MLTVDLVCVGDVDAEAVAYVSRGLALELGATASVLDALAIPPASYNPGRSQYSSTKMLEAVSAWWQGSAEKGVPGRILLALTGVDLYAPELNFVFGEAHPQRRVCIVSLARLGLAHGRPPVGKEHANERALAETVHEIGHVLGLGHCVRRDCVMFFSNSLADTDRKGHHFCKACGDGAAKSY